MKIIKKSEILPCECAVCHAIFQPEWRNLEYSSRLVKEKIYCPMCKAKNYVKFKEASNEQREAD